MFVKISRGITAKGVPDGHCDGTSLAGLAVIIVLGNSKRISLEKPDCEALQSSVQWKK